MNDDRFLHRLTRADLVEQMKRVREAFAGRRPNLYVAYADGIPREPVTYVGETDDFIWLATDRSCSPVLLFLESFIRAWAKRPSEARPRTFEYVLSELGKSSATGVVVGYPVTVNPVSGLDKTSGLSGIGRVLAVGGASTCDCYLFSVPYDIEAVNEEIRKEAANLGCERGGRCDGCPVPVCPKIDRAGEIVKERRKNDRTTYSDSPAGSHS